jgi:hypothetical protein
MAQQTRLDDFETHDIVTDGGVTDAVGEEWEGATLYTSWGYGQTNVELAEIVEVSDSGKTVLAQRVTAERETESKASESVSSGGERFGDTFRLHVRSCRGEPMFRGSYPYIDGKMETGTRLDSFSLLEDGDSVHQTPTQSGH